MLFNKRQVAGKIESVEGTAETLAAADAKVLAYNPMIDFAPDMFVRNPARTTFSKFGRLSGKRVGSYKFGVEMKGSGTPTTDPEWFKYLKACSTKVNTLSSINIGAITNGPFQHGETVTGGTSGATGRVIIKTTTGASALYLVVLTGTFASGEVLTGGTSGATTTTSSTKTDVGKVVEPLTTGDPCLTLAGMEDGIKKLLKGCRGSCKFNFRSGEPVMMDYNYMGVEAGITDVALLAGITYESQKPPVLLSASFSIDTVAAKISALDIDLGNVLNLRDDVNSDRGVLSYIIGNRETVGSFDPEMLAVATHDFHGKWFANTEMVLDILIGSVSGNKFRFYAPKVQYTEIKDEDRGNIKVARCSFDLNGTITPGDDEWALLHI